MAHQDERATAGHVLRVQRTVSGSHGGAEPITPMGSGLAAVAKRAGPYASTASGSSNLTVGCAVRGWSRCDSGASGPVSSWCRGRAKSAQLVYQPACTIHPPVDGQVGRHRGGAKRGRGPGGNSWPGARQLWPRGRRGQSDRAVKELASPGVHRSESGRASLA